MSESAREECDDQGVSSTCDIDCTMAMCGDSMVNAMAGEECDTAGSSASCDGDCTVARCSDGVINAAAGETCDANGVSTPFCDQDCSAPECGDGFVNAAANEQCDTAGESSLCDADCTAAWCGDGVVNAMAGEECDDGNRVDSDDCSSACLVQLECGNGDFPPFDVWPDEDGDGFGATNAEAMSMCVLPAGFVSNNGDCNDADPSVFQNDSTSTYDAQCLPWRASHIDATLHGVDPGYGTGTYGAALCSVVSTSSSGRNTRLKLVCMHQQGTSHDPVVDISIESEVLELSAALSVGSAVLLYTFQYIPDEDGSTKLAFVLKRPEDGRLLLAYTEEFTPGSGLMQIGLTPSAWYAPLTIQVTTGLCSLVPTECNVSTTRAALELSVPGADPVRILDHGRGNVGSLYGVHVAALERLSGIGCVDATARTQFLIYAIDPPCGAPSVEICNGIDDDDDSSVDEDNPGGGAPCVWSAGDMCAVGVTACAGGALFCEPPEAAEPFTFHCQTGQCDTGSPGRCARGSWSSDGRTCYAHAGPIVEQCNGVDDDCDGVIDDACIAPPPWGCLSHGIGICATGTTAFVAGSLVCVPREPSPESCDERDNDCDGLTDEELEDC